MNLDAIFALVSVDVIILLCVGVVLALISLRFNVTVPATIVLSLFLASSLQPLFLSTMFVSGALSGASPAIAFWVLFLLLAAIFFRLLTRHFSEEATLSGSLLAGLGGAVGIFAAWVHTPQLHSIHTFSASIAHWVTPGSVLLWILASLLILGFAQRQSKWI
ncbi:MAG: hypothetical protein KBE09_02930 [Candidatus Pacebacteria bacterium]|nr:hypothetical protein [Candidatus Paceibacterota bacterium]